MLLSGFGPALVLLRRWRAGCGLGAVPFPICHWGSGAAAGLLICRGLLGPAAGVPLRLYLRAALGAGLGLPLVLG